MKKVIRIAHHNQPQHGLKRISPHAPASGRFLQIHRQACRLTQVALGEQVGLGGETIRAYESGKRRIPEQWLLMLATALHLPPALRRQWQAMVQSEASRRTSRSRTVPHSLSSPQRFPATKTKPEGRQRRPHTRSQALRALIMAAAAVAAAPDLPETADLMALRGALAALDAITASPHPEP